MPPPTTAALALASAAGGALLSRTLARGRRPASTRALSPPDAALAAALAADPDLAFLTAGWPAAGERDAEKAALIAAARRVLAGAGDAASLDAARQRVLAPPVPDARPKLLPCPHGDGVGPPRVDPHYWLRDDARKDPDVLAHIERENAYFAASLADAAPVAASLAVEMRDAIQEADEGAPVLKRGWWHTWRTVEGGQYRLHTRRRAGAATPGGAKSRETDVPGPDAGPEEVVLDEDRRAEGHSFYMTAGVTLSTCGRYVAWGEDTEGGEKYTLKVADLEDGGREVGRAVPGTAGNYAFSADAAFIFYTVKDALDRPCTVLRHSVLATEAADVTVFHEPDDAFYVGVHRTRDDALVLITAGSAISNEVLAIRADAPTDAPVVLIPRAHDVECDVGSHAGAGALLVARRTAGAPNSELLGVALDPAAPLAAQAPLDLDAAAVLVPHRDDVKLEDYVLSADHVTLFERVDGAQRARVVPTPAGAGLLGPAPLPSGAPIDFDAAVYELGAGAQGDFASPVVRLSFSSLATPPTVVDVHAATRARCVKRVAPVLGGFDAAKYETRRLWATSHDGTRVPVSLVYRADLVAPGTPAPCLLNGYGSYEACNDPGFRQTKLPLLDRGVVFAIAHVRGGGEMGRKWYEDGKFDKKPSTWLDFVAVARHLVAEGVTDPSVLAIEGRSAGGLLIGAALNEAPDLFCAAVSGVGFVDVLTTMLDETIPLTVIERDEWGDPLNSADAYTSIAAYSPIDNVVPGAAYPTVMATCGLHDPRVGYWEPAKWVARLRAVGAPRGPILLKTELGAGHFSKSGRLERLLPVAEEHAFVLKSMGLLHAPKR